MICRPTRSVRLGALVCGLLSLLLVSHASGADELGVFWDSSYLQYEIDVPESEMPAIRTGYVVLKNPSDPVGILGYEFQLGLEGPAQFAGWNYEGQVINLESAPVFQVGVGGDPLPVTPDGVLIVTYQILVSSYAPIVISATPVSQPSVPDAMVFIPAADTNALVPMTTITGQDDVAWINGEIPLARVTPDRVRFGTIPQGESRRQDIVITNVGGGILPVEVSALGDCAAFDLVNYQGPVYLGSNESTTITVEFTPPEVGFHSCELDLGPTFEGPYYVSGTSREPIVSWSMTEELDFLSVEIGEYRRLGVTIYNTGEAHIVFAPVLPPGVPDFEIDDLPPGNHYIAPGTYRIFHVRFTPTVAADYDFPLDLGPVLPDVRITGSGVEPVVSWVLTPSILVFDDIAPGVTATRDFTITNNGQSNLSLEPVLPYPTLGFSIPDIPAFHLLVPGSSVTWTVEFVSPVPGFFHTALTLGGPLPDLPLNANVPVGEDPCLVLPAALDFGIVTVATPVQREVHLTNQQATPLVVDPTASSPIITIEGAPVTLQYGEHVMYRVTLTAPVAGPIDESIDFGNSVCGLLPVTATAEEPACTVGTGSLDFGEVPVGTTAARYLNVANDGPGALILDPVVSGPHFWTPPGPLDIPAGGGVTLTVYFQPSALGTFQATLDLGPAACQTVSLTGTGTSVIGENTNRIGIYFDLASTQNEWAVNGDGEVVTAYLVLSDASDLSGVIAWECQFGLQGDAFVTNWDLEGNVVNIGDQDAGEFRVGIAEPLPWSPRIRLATMEIFTFLGSQETALLSLTPVLNPSLDGTMAWIADADANALIPMFTSTQSPVVAIISGSSATPVEMPAPAATQARGEVQLTWSLPHTPGDGCHVYRRDSGGREEKLTAAPVVPEGQAFRFVDRPLGFQDGSLLTYSYTPVTDGIEGARSPGTEIRLAGVTALRTRLLANVPNPFNPTTEIHFEMDRTRQIRVTIYDVNGRLVRRLVDGLLAAGPHHRTWDGRDDRGRPVPSGAYYLRLVTESRIDHRKMMLLK